MDRLSHCSCCHTKTHKQTYGESRKQEEDLHGHRLWMMNKMNKNADIHLETAPRHTQKKRKMGERERAKARLKFIIKRMKWEIAAKKYNILRAPTFRFGFSSIYPQSVVRAPHLSPKRFHSLDIFIAFHLFDIYFSACSFLFILFKPPTNMMKKSKLKSVERKFLRYLGLVWKIQDYVPIFFLFIIHFRHTQPNTNRKAFE